jgi:uncharacterized membrane protein
MLQVSWSFGFKQRALLNLSNKRQAFENQTLQVGSVCLGWLGVHMAHPLHKSAAIKFKSPCIL